MNISIKAKRTAAVIAIALVIACLMPAAAFADTVTIPAPDEAQSAYVFDNSGYITYDGIMILDTRCEWLKQDGINVIISVENDPSALADQMADSRAQGLEGGNGVVVAINTTTGESICKAYGTAAEVITDERCGNISGIAASELAENGVYRACQSAVYNIDRVVNDGYEPQKVDYFMPSVTDNAGYLSESELIDLKQRLDGLRADHNIDVAVAIDAQMWGDTVEQAADNTYDYYMYGAGAGNDGILLYISKEPRMYQMTTYGYAITAFTDHGIEEIQSQMLPYLRNDDYYSACMAYADEAEYMLQQAESGAPYDVDSGDTPMDTSMRIWYSLRMGVFAALIFAIIAAIIATRSKSRQMNTAREKTDAHGYMKPGSLNISGSRDVFLYSHLDRREKPKDPPPSAGGGGSTVHISSSGRSHGGGGGSY